MLAERVKSVIDPPVAKTAPAFICVLTKRINAYRDKCYAVQDHSAAIENTLLAAHESGLGSCWYEGHITDDDRICDRIAEILDVPEGYDLVCILPMGKAKTQAAPKKKPFEERARFNGFGKGDMEKERYDIPKTGTSYRLFISMCDQISGISISISRPSFADLQIPSMIA